MHDFRCLGWSGTGIYNPPEQPGARRNESGSHRSLLLLSIHHLKAQDQVSPFLGLLATKRWQPAERQLVLIISHSHTSETW